MFIIALLGSLIITALAHATEYYADNTLPSNCTTGNYSKANRDCNGSDGNAYNTAAAAIAPLQPGDTIWVRGGVWDAKWDFQAGNKSGTVGNYITMAGYPGERPVLRYNDTAGYTLHQIAEGPGPISARGNRGYFIFENFILDGSLSRRSSRFAIRDGNHHFILRNVEITNFYGSGLALANGASDVTITECNIHDQRWYSTINSNHYGIYITYNTTNVVIERNNIHDNPGGGVHMYSAGHPGGYISNITIRNNAIHHNQYMPFSDSNVGGLIASAADVTFSNVQIYGNLIYKNGLLGAHPSPSGVTIKDADNIKIWNNVIYGNKGYGVNVQPSTSGGSTDGTTVQNNIIMANTIGETIISGSGTSGTITTYNGCTAADACGSSKITFVSDTEPFFNAASDDYRLKQGTNPARNTGTDIAVRPNYVTAPDIGAYEQPEVSTLDVVGSYIEMRINAMTPGVLPTSGITGVTVTCLGCTGTPVVDSANIKPSSNLVIQLAISGITSPGTCRVTVGATNITDSLFIGGSTFPGQGLNSLAATTVTGTCTNSSGVSLPGNPWSHFALNEGSGTVASDDTGNNRHGTVSAGVTWVADASGTGVTIPTDTAYRQITSTFGSGVNPTTQSFAKCVYVKPSLSGNTQKVVFSSGTNGSSQRWYAGWATVSGQVQWGIGIQGSGFLTGSEFPVTEKLTLVCIVNDSGADTATLWIDGVKGTIAGKSVKSFTSYVLTNNLIVGNDGTNTVNNGGFTVYEVWIWNTKPTDLNMTDLWASLAPPSTNPCMAQTHVQWEHVYTDQALAPIVITPKPDGSVDVIANGGVAFRIQYTCTGTAGVTISPTLYYSLNGTDFNLPVPQTLGANNVAMWGPVGGITYFNSDGTSGCLNSTGLTPHNGVTIIDTASTPSFALAQNHCRADRFIVQFGNVPDTAFYFRVKSFTGLDFANGYAQQVKVNVVQPQASVPW